MHSELTMDQIIAPFARGMLCPRIDYCGSHLAILQSNTLT
jgi:hypothetical protein